MPLATPTSAAPGAEVFSLFEALLDLPLQTEGKPSVAENLLDVLEICAVAAGLKTCHLHGDGLRDEARMRALEAVVRQHGLQTRRTPRARPPEPRPTRLHPEVHAHLLQVGDDRRAQAPDVLWVYRDPALSARIKAVVQGRDDLGGLLDYPPCCADAHAANHQDFLEAYVGALSAQYRTDDPAQIKALLDRDAAVDPARLPAPPVHGGSGLDFPYVSFDACSACTEPTGPAEPSPAGRAQAPLRALAFALSRPFAVQVWHARRLEMGVPLPALNEHCPCGSGQRFGPCCAAP